MLRRPVWPKHYTSVVPGWERVAATVADETAELAPGANLRTMMYNIHHGAGVDEVVDLERIADVLRAANPDILLLTEVDTHWRRSGFQDQATVLAKALHMPYAMAADTLVLRDPYTAGLLGTARYGIAMLSRYPVKSAKATPLPVSDWQEPRVALTADIQLNAESTVLVIGTHLGLNHEDRMAQIATINELAQEWSGPRVLMGDLNADSTSPELRFLTALLPPAGNAGGTPGIASGPDSIKALWVDPAGSAAPLSFPAWRPTKRIDFILVSPELAPRVVGYTSPESLASDHLPVLVEIGF